jgi:hypothetical protein
VNTVSSAISHSPLETKSRPGRIIGLLLLAQMIVGVLVNFVLLGPIFSPPGYLANASAHPMLFGFSALLGIAGASMSAAIAIAAYPVLVRHSQRAALAFVALSVAGLSASVVENMHLLSMLSLSESFANAAPADRDLFPLLKTVVGSARNWAHYLELIIGGSTLLVFYTALYRFALIPRVMAALGLVAVCLQLISVAMPFFGREVSFPMLAPLGLVQLLVALWFIAKGWSFASSDQSMDSKPL